jgi:nitrile hydratase
MAEKHGHGHGHPHPHPHEPIKAVQQMPEPVTRLIALGESIGATGLTVVEDSRLKADELSKKGVTKGLPYFEKRLMTTRAVLADKKVVTEEEIEKRKQKLADELEREGRKPTAFELGVAALTRLLIEKGIIKADDLERRYERVKARTPMTGAKVVARAWVDLDFKARLLQDPKKAILGLNETYLDANNGEPVDTWNITKLEVLENTEKVRNVIVCTLCSCYPRGLLGEPPAWYVSDSYRDRVVREPRAVLAEMGTHIPDGVELKVYDSSADIRYMVLPLRPKNSERLTEEQLAELVTRDSLVGVGDPLTPSQG